MSIDLSDKTILLTGGLGAIAEHVLKALDKAGATFVVTDRIQETEARKTLKSWAYAPTTSNSMSPTQ